MIRCRRGCVLPTRPPDLSVTLSIVIPVFNERQTIRQLVEAVLAVNLGAIDKGPGIIDQ